MNLRLAKTPLLLLAAVAATVTTPATSHADPCGMVPPIYNGPGVPIARVGDQNTFVFFKEGVETFVIRPGFKGKTDEFGMLIPFPAIPELRKVSDNIFPHIRAAIDPPEVKVYVYSRLRRNFFAANAAQKTAAPAGAAGLEMKRETVRVVKEEAVGMYEVAVLEAGSAKALKKWMDDHGYKYPKGMDAACEDYVKIGWCFVAVKTKVGRKKGADPKPGQRTVNTKMPKGFGFDGHVQAMGFRFKTPKLVVPMRLSTFNEGDLHNIVYVLADNPVKIRSVPEEYVVRQIAGSELYGNVTNPLPLRIIGGTAKNLNKWQKQNLPKQRNPVPHNGAARDVFASDLLAVKTGELSHPHEEKEKMLLRIGERLSLRGPDIDKLNEGALADKREKIVAQALADIKGMTLSVIDGNFPREVLANQNLTFAGYKMPARRNTSRFYDAKSKKPTGAVQGILFEGKLSRNEMPMQPAKHGVKISRKSPLPYGLAGLSLAAIGLVLVFRRKLNGRWLGLFIAAAALCTALTAPATVAAQEKQASEKDILALIDHLKDPKKATPAAEKLIKIGKPAVPHLIGEAIEGSDLSLRGWAIVCMAEIGGKRAKQRLVEIQNDAKQPKLVRTWAAAGRVKLATTSKELIELARLINQFPALKRPIGIKLLAKLQSKGKTVTAEELLTVSMQVSQLRQALAPAILNVGADKLTKVMVASSNQGVRRQAAAYLATLAQQGEDAVPSAVNKAYKFDPKAKAVPWNGGPLFIPGIRWKKDDATTLVRHLISWVVWIEENAPANQRAGLQRQLHNNLRSLSLASAAGYKSPGFGRQATPDRWLLVWGQAKGKQEVANILKSMDVVKKARWAKVLGQLN